MAKNPSKRDVSADPVVETPVVDTPPVVDDAPAADAPAALPSFSATTYDLIHPVTRVRFGQGYFTEHELDEWVQARLDTHWLKQQAD